MRVYSPPMASSSPSGLQASDATTTSLCAALLQSCCAPEGSQTVTEPSLCPLASSSPSGLQATDQTPLDCLGQTCRQRPVARSHSQIDPSSSLVASRRPSGCTASDLTHLGPCKLCRQRP